MIVRGAWGDRIRAGAALLICLALAALAPANRPGVEQAQAPLPEVRALWVLRSSIASPDSIETLVRSARQHGFNTLFVQVRGRGDAYYATEIEPRAEELEGQAREFDPLARLLDVARATGIRVHAWVNVGLVSSATHLPRRPEHVVRRHPDWLMLPRDLARELSRISPASPQYVTRLARWTRERSGEVEGLYASPAPAAVDHLRRVVGEIVRGYAIDGVHFDYVRYPSDRFDYSPTAVQEFRKIAEPGLTPARRRELVARDARDPLAFPDALPNEWRRFRLSRMTSLVAALGQAVKAERPAALVSVAVAADMREAREHRLQDWPGWLRDGIVDAVCPMAYTTEAETFAQQIAAARGAAGERSVWAGIGAYRLTPDQTIANIRTARRLGTGGIILFSYDSLSDTRQAPANYLSLVARAAFSDAPAAHGSR